MSMPHEAGSGSGERPTFVRYIVLMWLCLAATVAYVQRNSISVLESTVRADLGLDRQQMGWVLGSFFLTYGAFQIPGGWLGDRIGSRKALPLLSSLWSLATVLTALIGWGFLAARGGTSSLAGGWILAAWIGMLSARLIAGAAQAGIFPCAAVVIHRWFPGSHWAFSTGWLSAFQQVGAVFAAYVTGMLVGLHFSWPLIFLLFSLPGFAWAALFYGWFRDQPRDHASVNEAEQELITRFKDHAEQASSSDQPAQGAEPVPWGVLLTSGSMWAFCAQQFFRAAAYMFYASWFPTYLQESRGISVPQSGVLTSLPVLATFLGTVAGGTVSDWLLVRTGSRPIARQGLAIVGLAMSALLIFGAWFVEDAVAAVAVISAGSFCAAMAGPISYALSIEMGGRHVSVVFGAMNMSGSIGAFVFPLVVPLLYNATGTWDAVLILFALIYLAAAACWLLFDPRGTVFDRRDRRSPAH